MRMLGDLRLGKFFHDFGLVGRSELDLSSTGHPSQIGLRHAVVTKGELARMSINCVL